MVVTGDLTQVDLPAGVRSGLRDALDTLEGVPGIGVVRFDKRDVVRHPLVARIVDAYDQRAAAAGRQAARGAARARERQAAMGTPAASRRWTLRASRGPASAGIQQSTVIVAEPDWRRAPGRGRAGGRQRRQAMSCAARARSSRRRRRRLRGIRGAGRATARCGG